jgi:hypothetical protein
MNSPLVFRYQSWRSVGPDACPKKSPIGHHTVGAPSNSAARIVERSAADRSFAFSRTIRLEIAPGPLPNSTTVPVSPAGTLTYIVFPLLSLKNPGLRSLACVSSSAAFAAVSFSAENDSIAEFASYVR